MKKSKHLVSEIVDQAMTLAMKSVPKANDRAKLYRKVGLHFVDMAAHMEAEIFFVKH